MTVNYFLKCPVCGTVTRMRTPAGYIYRTPVRVHCGRCDTLMTGEFISDNEAITAGYTPCNCEEVQPQSFDYYGEASGELLSRKIKPFHADDVSALEPPMGMFSPVFAFMDSTPEQDRERFINFACFTYKSTENWDKGRIKYDLYIKGNFELLLAKCSEDAEKHGFQLTAQQEIIEYIYQSIFYDLGGLFKKSEIIQKFRTINYHLYHMSPKLLNAFLEELQVTNRLDTAQTKLFGILYEFRQIACNLIPAIGALYRTDFETLDKNMWGISTCSFEDIKSFYQDGFEALVDCCDLIVGLDNIENRGDCNIFHTNLDLRKFREQSKGNRIKILNNSEFFAGEFSLPVATSSLRNAIGHSDYKYLGFKQEIHYPEKLGSTVTLTSHLLDVALECCKMIQSTCVLAFVIYELLRYDLRQDDTSMPMHPFIYKGVKSQRHCPCGSRKKFRHCCKQAITLSNRRITDFDYTS